MSTACLIWPVPVLMLLIAVLAYAWLAREPEVFSKRRFVVLVAVGLLIGFFCGRFLLTIAAMIAAIWLYRALKRRAVFRYRFADEIGASLASKYPDRSAQDRAEIIEGLRDVFLIAVDEATPLALPSLAVADAWSALPNESRYRKCLFRLGPCAVVQPGFVAEGRGCDALSATWRLCCDHEGIDEHFPERLPRLFALDARLAIPGGSRYSVEADNQPPGDPLLPVQLMTAIGQRLDPVDAGDARRRVVSMLARRIHVSLAVECYPHDEAKFWSDAQLSRLFDTIRARNDLLVATFGDIATADVELARAKATPREPDPGCSFGAQSVDAVGGAGARR